MSKSNYKYNPIDYFNHFGDFVSIFSGQKDFKIISSVKIQIKLVDGYDTFCTDLLNGTVKIHREYKNLATDGVTTKFMLLTEIMFNGNQEHAESYIKFDIIKCEIPYIRVGVDYFHVFPKSNRYGYNLVTMKATNKQTIVDDHGKEFIQLIPKFNDFTLEPNNTEYSLVFEGCYNQYSPFPHKPSDKQDISIDDFPATATMLCHIFGDEQVMLALTYMQCLYLYPKQPLPILCLVSKERGTGKTTFLNWISMLFGNNTALISPSVLASDFNSSYSDKNIILIDETTIEKSSTIERLKALATQKEIIVNQKFVSNYAIPFYGKVILCTNKEEDFLKVEEDEIRFWIRKVPKIQALNTLVELDLGSEIPSFLKFLTELPAIDFTKSRMIFTSDQIKTNQLDVIMEESKSGLRKELEYHLEDFFLNNSQIESFYASASDIKERWFSRDNQISIHYISKIIRAEMKMNTELCKYHPFSNLNEDKKTGRPYKFTKKKFANFSQTIDL